MEQRHKSLEEFSNKVEVAFDHITGRHIVAAEDIKPFETILVEDPMAWVLYPSKGGFNCAHCLARLKAAIPCKKCAGALFCSVHCRDEAFTSYHQWECEFHEVLNGLGCSSVARLALRLITSRPLAFFLDLKEVITSKQQTDDKYIRLLNLVGLEGQRWPEDFLARSAMAVVLLGILRASGYFGGVKKSSSNPDSYTANELFIGSLILRHLQVISCQLQRYMDVIIGNYSCYNSTPTKFMKCYAAPEAS